MLTVGLHSCGYFAYYSHRLHDFSINIPRCQRMSTATVSFHAQPDFWTLPARCFHLTCALSL